MTKRKRLRADPLWSPIATEKSFVSPTKILTLVIQNYHLSKDILLSQWHNNGHEKQPGIIYKKCTHSKLLNRWCFTELFKIHWSRNYNFILTLINTQKLEKRASLVQWTSNKTTLKMASLRTSYKYLTINIEKRNYLCICRPSSVNSQLK